MPDGFDPAEFAASKPAAPAFDPAEFAAAKPQAPARSTLGDIAAEGGKGLLRGAQNLAGDLGEAVMGPFGPSHHLANLKATLGYGERPAAEPSYGQQLA